jgi:hypothetical protein
LCKAEYTIRLGGENLRGVHAVILDTQWIKNLDYLHHQPFATSAAYPVLQLYRRRLSRTMVMKDSVVVLFERPLPYQGTAHIFILSLLAFWLRFMLYIKPSSPVNLTCVLCVAQTSEISGTVETTCLETGKSTILLKIRIIGTDRDIC